MCHLTYNKMEITANITAIPVQPLLSDRIDFTTNFFFNIALKCPFYLFFGFEHQLSAILFDIIVIIVKMHSALAD